MKLMIIRNEGDRQRFIDFIKNVDLKKPFVGTFKPFVKRRSLSQNKLFHMWMALLEKETGTSREVWKEFYKKEFLEVYTDVCFGKEVTTIQHTAELDSKECSLFTDKVHMHASHEGYDLPLPGDQGYDQFILEYEDRWKSVR